jgi:hypothetical protein
LNTAGVAGVKESVDVPQDSQNHAEKQPAEQPADFPADLMELAALWPSLPEAVRAGFVATAKALTEGKQ